MSIARSALIGGPAKIYSQSAAIWSPDTLSLSVEPETNEVTSSLFGRMDEAEHNRVVKISPFTVFGLWQSLAILFPSFYTNPSIGARLFGDADVPWKIWSNNGDLDTIVAGAVMKPPTLKLGPASPVFGQMEIGGVVGTGLNPSGSNSYWQHQVAQADPGGALAMTNYKQQEWSAAWGAISGFASFQAEDQWTIDFLPKLEPVKIQGYTRDYKLVSMAIQAKCKPVGPTQAQIYTALEDKSAGARLGSGSVGDLNLTGADGSSSVVLTNMALKNRRFDFGGKELRNGEMLWVNIMKFTTGAPSALIALS